MTDENGDDEGRKWHELDQTVVRTAIRKLITTLPSDYDALARASKELLTIVQEEIAEQFAKQMNLYLESPHRTAAQSRRLVNDITRDLRDAHLVIRHPLTSEPCVLQTATTPPTGDQSWLELVTSTQGRERTLRLKEPLPHLKLAPERPLSRSTDIDRR